MAIFLTRELTDLSLPQIGRLYGGRDHSTVLNSLRRVEAGLAEDPELAERVQELTRRYPQSRRRASADGRWHCKNQPFPTAASTGPKPRSDADFLRGPSSFHKP